MGNPSQVVLRIHPKQYLKQGLNHCGVFAVKGILSALGIDDKLIPEEYHINRFGRLIGFASPQSLVKIMHSYGVDAFVKDAGNMSNQEKLEVLTHQLRTGNPVMIRIGNGFNRSDGTWSRFRWFVIGHWITLWGYDDQRGIFYVYDPAVPDALDDKNIPIGNKKRAYQEIIRDWSWSGLLTFTLPRFLYIELHT